MTYRISTISEITGIPRNTLLAWERRYGLVKPVRHENGYRAYSDADLDVLMRLRNALSAGLRISEAVALIAHPPTTTGSVADSPTEDAGSAEGGESFSEVCRTLTAALIEYRRSDAEVILNRLLPIPFRVRLREVYFPVLKQVGDLWAEGTITIAQEHYASAVLRTHLAALLVSIGSNDSSARHAVCTTFAGEEHEMAALALAIQLSISGFRVSYLGANLPPEELALFCKRQPADLVTVSCIIPPNAEAMQSYIAGLGKIHARRVVIGGNFTPIPVVAPIELLSNWADLAVS